MEFKELVKEAFYYDKTGMLLKGDCLDWMEKFPDGSVDMILADLPYGTTACKWDTIIPFNLLWKQYERISKQNTPIVLFGSEPFSSLLRTSNLKMFRYDIIWNKRKPSNFQMMNFQPGRVHEVISVFSKSPAVFCRGKNMKYYPIKTKMDKERLAKNTFYGSKGSTLRDGHTIKNLQNITYTEKHPTTIIEFSNANIKEKKHPTEKPVELFEYLIKTYSIENDIVLDNTAGVCTTAVAAKNTNRKWICIEKEEKYCKLSKDRLQSE